jgi:hypothetical protein
VDEGATERGKRVIDALLAAGRRSGLDVQSEYPVVGGRVDVVWLWPSPTLAEPLPVAGFEIESSWRTRKHIKGDYLNLLDLQPAVGVIVSLGEGAKVDSTRIFARQMVQRRPGRMHVWSEAEVESLAAGAPSEDLEQVLPPEHSGTGIRAATRTALHTGKYSPVAAWLVSEDRDLIEVTFEEVEEVLGFPLPASARKHPAYWSGGQAGSTVGNAIRDAGWQARNLDLHAGRVVLEQKRR